MKNSISCKNCGHENPLYGLICANCKAYLRERRFNIDFWSTLGLLVEDPVKGFLRIIQSEHKNLISFLLLLTSLKLLIDTMFVSLFSLDAEPEFSNFIRNYLIISGELLIIILIISIIFKLTTKIMGVQTRIKDNLSILIYSFIPHIFGLILLTIVEFTIFGVNLFSRNPSPFVLKSSMAYILMCFEFLVILWGMFLSYEAFFAQTKNIFYSLGSAVIFNLVIYSNIYLNTFFMFNK